MPTNRNSTTVCNADYLISLENGTFKGLIWKICLLKREFRPELNRVVFEQNIIQGNQLGVFTVYVKCLNDQIKKREKMSLFQDENEDKKG